ncbi:MAG: FAD-binding oxidoreductase, partial [Candidatus Bathyarchaeota archaeon]|nr:FAD-binding oxidoreductase [Candidatus Bathyarchaeota archaeon]
TKYGKMEDMILALRVVLPTGEIFQTRAAPGKATGPDLNHLFIGCEGTLGVVTEAVMKIHHMPEERRFRGVLFPDVHSGIEAMRKIMQKDIVPCLARLYDEEETGTKIKDTWGIKQSGALLVIGFDGLKEMVDLEESMGLEICEKEGGKDLGSEPGEHWWQHKYDDYYPTSKSVKEYRALLGGREIGATSDTCAPYDKIEDLYFAMKNTFWEKFGNEYGGWFYGHFSHWYKSGAMLYPRWHLYEIPKSENPIEIYWEVWGTMARVALQQGGVLNHHHGLGTILGRFLPEQYGAGFEVLKKIKKSLDPRNILNPGVLGLEGR